MKQRLLSLDVFRGATVAFMVLVNNPGDWAHIYAPLEHAEWNGCTPTDCVFPFFLFMVGTSIPFALGLKKSDEFTFQRIIIRTLKLFLFGLFLNFFSKITFGIQLDELPFQEIVTGNILLLLIRLFFTAILIKLFFTNFKLDTQYNITITLFLLAIILAFFVDDFKNVRIPGVLQRIALVYFFCSLLFLVTTRIQLVLFIFILGLYWFLMTVIAIPNGLPANLEPTTNLAAWLDNALLNGHLWATSKVWDPEGILSTLPAIATGLAGVLAGTWILKEKNDSKKVIGLVVFGVLGIIYGLLWHEYFPINKALWTSSFVLYTAGWASLILAILYWLIDVKGITFFTKPFLYFGVNAIVVFFLSGIIPRALNMIKISTDADEKPIGLQNWLYNTTIAPYFSTPKNASLVGALTFLFIWLFILAYMYRKKYIFKV